MPPKPGRKKPRRMEYLDVEYDQNGWADPSKFLPADCDLMCLKLQNGKQVNGWLVGDRWEGLKKKKTDRVVAWRREVEPM